MHWNIRMLLRFNHRRRAAKHVRKQDKEILNSRGEWERQRAARKCYCAIIRVAARPPREGETAELEPLLARADVLGDSALEC